LNNDFSPVKSVHSEVNCVQFSLMNIMHLNIDKYRHQLEILKQRIPRTPFCQSTFCIRLWKEAFITDDGDVYPCCHKLPWKVGNLYKDSLEEIWNDGPLKLVRYLSRHRGLYCYERCTLLDEMERQAVCTEAEKGLIEYGQLRRIKILFGQLCNISCIMCDQNHRSKKQLSVELLREKINWTNIEDIEFQGGGTHGNERLQGGLSLAY